MKRTLTVFLFLLAFSQMAHASLEGSISEYLPEADTIYLVRVVSFAPMTVNFSVTETLRGTPVKSLSLIPGIIDLKQGGEFLIISSNATRTGQWGNHVGSLFKGNLGWQDAPIVREGEDVYVRGDLFKNGKFERDKTINGVPFLTLDHIKQLVKESAPKT